MRLVELRGCRTFACDVRGLVALAMLVGVSVVATAQGSNPVPRPPQIPRSGAIPRDAAVEQKLLADVKAPEGFTVSLFAGPPVAMYPTCVNESPDGAVFVCVDPNLSLSTLKGVGRVMRLVDVDGDGRADRYTTFAEMDSPRGVVSDGKTVFVMHPPNLTAYRDTNGDGIADESTDIVTGLGFDLDFRGADHSTNNIELAADGWLYVAVGDYGFLKAVGTDGRQLQHRGGAVVRVRPDGTNLELVSTGVRNIYDVAIDPFMRLYARDNTNDGDGWDTRLHYMAPGANMGFPQLYKNFGTEHFPSLADYGAGAGVGALWLQDPAWPAGFANTLYTGDWTTQKIYRHSLAPNGAIFTIQQEEFVSVLRPADMALDGNSNLYVTSLAGGQFTYNSDTVGYVVRVRPSGGTPSREASVFGSSEATLLAALGSGNAVHRLHAQQELLRRGETGTAVQALRRAVADGTRSADARAAAIFTLKQLVGARAHDALVAVAGAPDARVRETALRALADRTDQLRGVPHALFVKGLADPDFHVRAQAINGLVRLGAHGAADALLPLASSPDQALSHLAVNALVRLGAFEAASKGLDGTPAMRAGALRALGMMHEPGAVTALIDRLERTSDASARGAVLRALARQHNREGYWRGEWWTTKPAHLGPWFDPSPWEESPRIRASLAAALVSASDAELASLAGDYARLQVLPRGAAPLLTAVTLARDPLRSALIESMVGRPRLGAEALAIATQVDAKGGALHGAVAQLLAGETTLGAGALTLARNAAIDVQLEPRIRAALLGAISQVPGQSALDVVAEVFARLNPTPRMPAAVTPAAVAAATPTPPAGTTAAGDPVEVAWRRFVGDRRRAGELDFFIRMATTGQPSQRTLAYAVLVQSIRAPRTPAVVREKVTPVIESAWTDPLSAPSLVQAIGIMRLDAQYAEKLAAHAANRPR